MKKVLRLKRVWVLFILSALFSLPFFSTLVLSVSPAEPVFKHLWETVLPGYIKNTLLLMVGVGIGSFFLGLVTATLVSFFKFPGRQLFQKFLILPLAIPGFVIGTVYLQFFEYSGPFQSLIRKMFGFQKASEYWFPEIASLGGVTVVLSFILFPYIFMTTRSAFMEQSQRFFEVSRSLGKGPISSFISVILPLSRPSLTLGLSLVLMEAASDFGTVHFFGVPTLTSGIYSVWLQMNNLGGAAQLASMLLSFMILFLTLEKWSRSQKSYYSLKGNHRQMELKELKGLKGLAAFSLCFIPLFFGFLFPFSLLLFWSFSHIGQIEFSRFLNDLGHTIFLALSAGGLCLLFSLLFNYIQRSLGKTRLVEGMVSFATLGYAIPGPVLALGVLIPLAKFDNFIDSIALSLFGNGTGLIFSGSVAAILLAYLIRFFVLSYGSIQTGFLRITPKMDEAAIQLGAGVLDRVSKIHGPLLKRSLATSLILVFVDSMKELPATLMLRPFNYNTLATRLYELSSDERLMESAPWGVAIVLSGLLPLIILGHPFGGKRNNLKEEEKES